MSSKRSTELYVLVLYRNGPGSIKPTLLLPSSSPSPTGPTRRAEGAEEVEEEEAMTRLVLLLLVTPSTAPW